MEYYDKNKRRIVFIEAKASNDFWDKKWLKNDIKKTIESGKNEKLVSSTTKKFINPDKGKIILEGGCGMGNRVYSLNYNGYSCIGVDYAEKTINKIKSVFPDLDVRVGDVRRLNFPDSYFDGYWSLGVIEHFYDGYAPIMKEMQRVIKKGGYLFLTFPVMSFLRKTKARLGLYPLYEEDEKLIGNFYQFALNQKSVIKDLKRLGFVLEKEKRIDGLKGLKDEINFLRPFLQKIYNSQSIFSKILKKIISIVFTPFSNHCVLLVLRNK